MSGAEQLSIMYFVFFIEVTLDILPMQCSSSVALRSLVDVSLFQSQLKSLLSVIIMTRKGYQLRDGCFRHSFGTQWPALSAPSASMMHLDVNTG